MSNLIRINNDLYEQAKSKALIENRTVAGQIEFWAMVGKTVIDNPELPVQFVVESLLASKEVSMERLPFDFRED